MLLCLLLWTGLLCRGLLLKQRASKHNTPPTQSPNRHTWKSQTHIESEKNQIITACNHHSQTHLRIATARSESTTLLISDTETTQLQLFAFLCYVWWLSLSLQWAQITNKRIHMCNYLSTTDEAVPHWISGPIKCQNQRYNMQVLFE